MCGDKFEEELHLNYLLYEFPAETRLTVYRRLDSTKTIAKRARVEPRTQMHVTMKILI